jgi:AraC family transcriptional regulator
MFDVTLKTIPTLKVISIQHRGAYNKIGQAYDKLFSWLGPRGLVDAQTRILSIGYDNPVIVPQSK